MGDLFSLYCRDCSFSQELRLGVGMLFLGSENLVQMLPKGKQERVQELLSRPNASLDFCHHDLFLCPKCDLQASRLNFQINYGDEQVYQPYFRCSYCRTRLVKDDHPRLMDHCPSCGSTNLIIGEGDWD